VSAESAGSLSVASSGTARFVRSAELRKEW